MKFVLAFYGTRGDVDPSILVGRELLRRGHDVQVAVAPDMVGFVESAGLPAVAFGLETQAWLDAYRNFWVCFFQGFWRIHELRRFWSDLRQPISRCWEAVSATLTPLADGADLLFTGLSFQKAAANVAEHYNIPLATLHYIPVRVNGQLLPFLPPPLIRSAMTFLDWLDWRMEKKLEDSQRCELDLPKAAGPLPRRIAERGSLEIQAYDEVCFPGLAAEWTKWGGHRPFVGALTMEVSTDADVQVASWIAAGTPPIFFGFGSMPVESAADTLATISSACAQLCERALVCAGWSDFSDVVHRYEHVKVVGAVNFAAIFPLCRAVVHHGGAGTTAISLRAGVPTIILSTDVSQTLWGAQVKRLKVGTARRFSINQELLVADLRRILAPEYVARAREIATRMTKPAASVTRTADLLEDFVRQSMLADR